MKTLAHKILNTEKNFGTGIISVSPESYEILGNILKRAKEIDTEQDPETIFANIAQSFEEEGLKHKGKGLFSHSLESGRVDCKPYSILYFSIGEILDLPISLALAPNHVFPRYDDGKRRFNFETTMKVVCNDQYYIDKFGIAEESLSQGVYLKSLETHEELMFLAHNSLGVFMDPANSIAMGCFDKAIESNPTYVDSYCNRADAKRKLEDFEGAFADISIALELDPHLIGNYRILSFIHEDLGHSHKAEECIETAFAFAFDDFERAILHNRMGNIRRRRGDVKRAIKDYSKAIKLDPDCDGYRMNRKEARKEIA